MITIGGGEILDAMPKRHRVTDKSVVEKLRFIKDGTIDDRLGAVVNEAALATIELARIAGRCGVAPARARDRLKHLEKAGNVRALSENPYIVVSSAAFKEAADLVVAAVKKFHESNALVQGISREELKARLFGSAPNLVFQAVIDKLVRDKRIAIAQDLIYEFGRKVTLKADEERMRSQLTDRFRSLGLQAPSADEIIDALKLDRPTARKIIQLLLKENALVKITEEMFVERASIDKLIADVKALKSKNPKFGVGEFKNLTGVTRKHAIPLLEYLDRQRVTRRVGDERMIL
jgi:selenocysteine-specific elongation factor